MPGDCSRVSLGCVPHSRSCYRQYFSQCSSAALPSLQAHWCSSLPTADGLVSPVSLCISQGVCVCKCVQVLCDWVRMLVLVCVCQCVSVSLLVCKYVYGVCGCVTVYVLVRERVSV